MSFNAKQFCDDYRIPYPRTGKHARPGWVNVACPFCTGHPGWHGGFNIKESYYNCWRCGNHWLPKAISALAGINNISLAIDIQKKYSSNLRDPTPVKQDIKRPSKIDFPAKTGPLTKQAIKYLENRNFDAFPLASQWGLLSTSHLGFYKFRILAPIYLYGKLVSYQCRDVTDKSDKKYLACKQKDEIVEHQNTLYGLDQTVKKTCLIVEGITDVWRMGHGSIATYGIDFTKAQIDLIVRNFDSGFIMFDSEELAQQKAEELAYSLQVFGKEFEILTLPEDKDPGDLTQQEANEIMKEIEL